MIILIKYPVKCLHPSVSGDDVSCTSWKLFLDLKNNFIFKSDTAKNHAQKPMLLQIIDPNEQTKKKEA